MQQGNLFSEELFIDCINREGFDISRLHIAKGNIFNSIPYQSQDRKTNCGKHLSHLAVLTFRQCDLYPGYGNIFPVTDRWVALRNFRVFRKEDSTAWRSVI
jgi:hypothetical protein